MGNKQEKILDRLHLPREVFLNIPLLEMEGLGRLRLENYKSILEFTSTCLRVQTEQGVFCFQGFNIFIRYVNSQEIFIEGTIRSICIEEEAHE